MSLPPQGRTTNWHVAQLKRFHWLLTTPEVKLRYAAMLERQGKFAHAAEIREGVKDLERERDEKIGARDEQWLEHVGGLRAALNEAAMLLETAAGDGHVTKGWCEDARRWRDCWADVLGDES